MNLSLDIASLISSYWGMYVVQTVIHSTIASLVVECALLAWAIRTPHVKQWFRFIVILLPIVLFPLYQLMVPRRGDVYFRIESLLDSNRWFFIGQWGSISMLAVFAFMLAITSVIFIIQELVPIFSHILEQMHAPDQSVPDEVETTLSRKVSKALKGLPLDENFVQIIDDEDLTLFSSTGLKPMIFVSTGLIEAFSTDHLHVAFAHEIAHIQRSKKPILIFAYILRMIVFFNPIAMIEFRRLAHEEEKVCDDIAIALTGKPEKLSEAIEMLRPTPEDYDIDTSRGAERFVSTIEHYSHDVLLKSRALRIRNSSQEAPLWGVPFIVTIALIVSINYFIV
jgi:Zn-dependent protease with chaperone function